MARTTSNSVTSSENHAILVHDGSADVLQTCFAFALSPDKASDVPPCFNPFQFLPDSVYR
jgi:hypothetical protein